MARGPRDRPRRRLLHRARRAWPRWCARAPGSIIFIGSISPFVGVPGQANYAAAKAGLVGLARALAKEVATRGVTVNVVAPGLIDTDMTSDLGDARKDTMAAMIPMGRIGPDRPISPELSGSSPVTTPATSPAPCIAVDGGLVARACKRTRPGARLSTMERDKTRGTSMDRNEALAKFTDNTVEVLAVDPRKVTLEASFGDDLGADSLDLVELVMALEETFDIEVAEDELKDITHRRRGLRTDLRQAVVRVARHPCGAGCRVAGSPSRDSAPLTCAGRGRRRALERALRRTSHPRCKRVAPFDATHIGGPKELRRLDPFTLYALMAADEAWRQSGLDGPARRRRQHRHDRHRRPADRPRAGPRPLREGPRPRLALHGADDDAQRRHRRGVDALRARRAVRDGDDGVRRGHPRDRQRRAPRRPGRCTVAVAGGAEAVMVEIAEAGFRNMTALSNTDFSRPFDVDRDGFVMGEGAGILILEEWEHAHARGATILAEVIGAASTADAHHITAPDPSGHGAIRCMELALADAGVTRGRRVAHQRPRHVDAAQRPRRVRRGARRLRRRRSRR